MPKQRNDVDHPPRVTVCGIGASAGGLEALREFFAAVPADLGIAYVVIVHLAPWRESELASLLASRTKMPVREVRDDQKLEITPDCVYVIAANRVLEIAGTTIGASSFKEPRGDRAPIDVFFRSLAESHGGGFAVILSGGDGAVGAKAVKESGGVVLVQDPREAAPDGMPRAVIAPEIADFVLPVKELAARLAELVRHKETLVPLMRMTNEPDVDENDEAAVKRQEEIQVANEELTPLNIENGQRVDELGKVSSMLRHLLQSTGIATLFLDDALRIVRFTPQLGEIFNVREVDVGRPVAEITHQLDYDELVEDARRTLDHLANVDREVYSKRGRWYLTRMLPYRGPTDRVEGVVLTFVDITDRRSAEQELRDADRRKDEFLALLAHELRNPLAPIVAGIDLLKQVKDNPQLLEQVTATMARQAKQLVRLVDDLLELSRVSGGRLRLRKARVQLRDVVRDAVASVRPIIERQRHDLVVKLPDEPIELEADSARLTQVFANLLNNAARYTPEGGRVAIGVAREGQDAVFTVTDNGIGIAATAIPRIFEMFYQGDEGKPGRGGGLGIGLTLARSLVEMHGGTITAASAGSGRGSEFKVRLPVAERPAAGEREEQRAVDKPLGGHRVLIVDDNTDAARTLGMLVETLGQNEVHVANNGSDALRIAEERRPDIVLLDLKMPGMDGYEVARRLRSEAWGRDLTLVAVTGWTLEDHKRRSRDAGFDRHLTKPADVAALAALLSSPGIGARPNA